MVVGPSLHMVMNQLLGIAWNLLTNWNFSGMTELHSYCWNITNMHHPTMLKNVFKVAGNILPSVRNEMNYTYTCIIQKVLHLATAIAHSSGHPTFAIMKTAIVTSTSRSHRACRIREWKSWTYWQLQKSENEFPDDESEINNTTVPTWVWWRSNPTMCM